MSYVLEDYKFGAGGYGVSGGTVTYSFATSNFANEAYADPFLTGQYQTEVRAALAAWEAVANIHFVEVADSTASNLRFGFVNDFAAKPWSAFEAGGAGGRAGQASVFYDNSPIHHVTDADIAFDGREGWQVVNGEILTGPGGTRFFSIALHEIGHVLGIDHDPTLTERSIMHASLDPSYKGLEAVDIQAAQFIYGAAAAPVAGSVSISDVTVVEGNSGTKEAIFTVTRAAGSGTAAFDVTYATANGSGSNAATAADGDYAGQTNILHFNAGQLSQTVKILVNGDTKFEGNESFFVNLTNPTNGATITKAQGVATITNDDAAPVAGSVSISDVTVVEGNSGTKEAIFTVTRAASSGTAAFDVTYATANGTGSNAATAADGDYASQTNILHFNAGQLSQTVKILVNGDTKFEGNESFFINLTNPTNGATITKAQGVATITNDDAAPVAGSVSISDVTVVEGNSGTKEAIFTVTRAAGSGTAAFDVTYATANGTGSNAATAADGDYASQTNILHFNAGQLSQTVKILVNGDTKFEGNESFFVNLSNATNGATISDAQGIGTITNDDVAAVNTAPVATGINASIATNGSIAASSLFTAIDQQGNNTITQYAFWDGGNGGGHFTVNGVTQASGQWIYVAANNLASIKYDGGAAVGSETLFVSAFDGQAWSSNASLTASTVDRAPEDFGGDGKSDLLWHNDNGSVAMWQMNGTQIASSQTFGSIGTAWDAASTGDSNGDGKSDILWLNDNGSVAMWQMNGTQITANQIFGSIASTWDVAAVDDFNADGKDDILWHNDNGAVALWQMNGTQIAANQSVGSVANGWHIEGTGDFNGNGAADILLRNDAGDVAMWQMNGSQITSNQTFGSIGTAWHFAGADDFNGDGKDDILWHNDNGSVAIWQMNGTQIAANQVVGSAATTWNIVDVGDYNNDDRADILWQHDGGSVAMWQMNGMQTLVNQAVGSMATTWDLV